MSAHCRRVSRCRTWSNVSIRSRLVQRSTPSGIDAATAVSWSRGQERPGVERLLRRESPDRSSLPRRHDSAGASPRRSRCEHGERFQRDQLLLASRERADRPLCRFWSACVLPSGPEERNRPIRCLRAGDWWLSAAMEPIERVFIAMAVIGLVGFVATLLYVTSH
jgi:hypothetical protein